MKNKDGETEMGNQDMAKIADNLGPNEAREEADGTDKQGDKQKRLYLVKTIGGDKKAFLVVREKTFEVRTDRKLGDFLRTKYESIMESRYFGQGGIELVKEGQLTSEEMEDLVRLSYDLTRRIK